MNATSAFGATIHEEEKEEETLTNNVDHLANTNGASNMTANSNSNPNPKAPPLQKPSYYIDSFHEHFFPHPDDETTTSLSTRKRLSIPQRYATSMARRPWTHLSIAFVIAVFLSFIGLRFGNFTVAIDNAGWWSRGTIIANRATQEILVSVNRNELFYDTTGEVWKELQTVIQPNWQGGSNDDEEGDKNAGGSEVVDNSTLASVCSGEWYGSRDMIKGSEKNLVGIWKTTDAESKNPEISVLGADAMYDLCMAEENTLKALQSSDLCYKCTDISGEGNGEGKCIEPYSLILMARFHLARNDISQLSTLSESIPCDTLRSLWLPTVQNQFTIVLKTCVNWSIHLASGSRNKTITIQDTTITITDPCPFPITFLPTVVDELFPTVDQPIVRYSSSYYATKKSKMDVEGMFEASGNNAYDRSDGNPLSGVYDTNAEDFYQYYQDAIIGRDMALAVGSAGVTVIAMLIHTKSPFLTLMGLFQILLSFPLAYFVYYFVFSLVFFPFLNFIGIFVVFALGADDVFVAVDKWKSARQELPHGTTEQVAALALPDAAYAMLLTSTTTAVAFFATAICPGVLCNVVLLLLIFPDHDDANTVCLDRYISWTHCLLCCVLWPT